MAQGRGPLVNGGVVRHEDTALAGRRALAVLKADGRGVADGAGHTAAMGSPLGDAVILHYAQ